MPKKQNSKNHNGNGVSLGIEHELWAAADKLRGHLDAADYKSVVLGLIFLKYISDLFEQVHARVEREGLDDPEDRDVYLAERVFWVPKEARWKLLQDNAMHEDIGNRIDQAMEAIEHDNPSLKGMLPGNYGRPTLDKRRLGELVTLFSNKVNFVDEESRKQDTLGRVYEYFLSQFAGQEGRHGGEFYTPRSVVRVLVEVLSPYKGRVFDPCCGSGGMFVQSEKFMEAHGGRVGDISVYGQESNPNTYRMAKMNLAIRGIDGDLGREPADSFFNDQHPDLKADFVLANPPFNMSDWGGDSLRTDKRWKYGLPPVNNANFAWIQHFIHHLAPTGMAGFVMANGSMSSNTSNEGAIRQAIIEADMVDCVVALPGQLFYSTQIPVCLWFLSRNKQGRQGRTLFIDARKLGTLTDRVHRDLTDADIARIAGAYHAWKSSPLPLGEGSGVREPVGEGSGVRGPLGEGLGVRGPRPIAELSPSPITEPVEVSGVSSVEAVPNPTAEPVEASGLTPAEPAPHPITKPVEVSGVSSVEAVPNPTAEPVEASAALPYADLPGFCKSATLADIRSQGYVLTPGRYVGAAELEEDDEPFEQKMEHLKQELEAQFEESKKLEGIIRKSLELIYHDLGK